MEVGTFRIYCHFCVRLRHLTSWRFCTENMYFCFTWYFHIDSKIYLHFIFSKSFTYFWKHTFNMCWTRTSVKILIWCKKKQKKKQEYMNVYISTATLPMFLIHLFLFNATTKHLKSKTYYYQQQYVFVSVNEHHCMIVQNQNSCISIKSLFPAFVRVYLKTINYHFFWRGLG